MLPEFIWDASMLEGNPFTFPEVMTLLDGVTVGGHKLSDQEQIQRRTNPATAPLRECETSPIETSPHTRTVSRSQWWRVVAL